MHRSRTALIDIFFIQSLSIINPKLLARILHEVTFLWTYSSHLSAHQCASCLLLAPGSWAATNLWHVSLPVLFCVLLVLSESPLDLAELPRSQSHSNQCISFTLLHLFVKFYSKERFCNTLVAALHTFVIGVDIFPSFKKMYGIKMI